MAIAMKDFAAMLRRKGGNIGASKVADILDDCDRAAIALEAERDTLRARVAELEGLLREARKEVAAGIRARELLDGGGSHIERAKVIKHEITRALEASGIDTDNVKDGE